MFTLVVLYTLYSLVYPLYIYPLHCIEKSGIFLCLYDQSLSDTRTTFLLRVNDSLSFADEWLRQGLQKLIFVTLPRVRVLFFGLINFIHCRKN